MFEMSNKKRKHTEADPTPFRGEFSFVNKDASNIGSKDHNAAVSWHVVNRYERWKKQQQAGQLRGSTKNPSTGSSSADRSTPVVSFASSER